MSKSLFPIAIKLKNEIVKQEAAILAKQKILFVRANELKEKITDLESERKIANEIENER